MGRHIKTARQNVNSHNIIREVEAGYAPVDLFERHHNYDNPAVRKIKFTRLTFNYFK